MAIIGLFSTSSGNRFGDNPAAKMIMLELIILPLLKPCLSVSKSVSICFCSLERGDS